MYNKLKNKVNKIDKNSYILTEKDKYLLKKYNEFLLLQKLNITDYIEYRNKFLELFKDDSILNEHKDFLGRVFEDFLFNRSKFSYNEWDFIMMFDIELLDDWNNYE
jgi:hypothetical protein